MVCPKIAMLLVILALVVLAILFSKSEKIFARFKTGAPNDVRPFFPAANDYGKADLRQLTDLNHTARQCRCLAEAMGAVFRLVDLYRLLEDNHWPHPHLTIRSLREKGMLLPRGDGNFVWNLSDPSDD